MHMTEFFVSGDAQLKNALSIAQAGDTITLASGTYAPVTIKGQNNASEITIRSLDPDNQAVMTGLMVKDSSGFKFSDLAFASKGETSFDFQVLRSENVHFDHIEVYGPAENGADATTSPFMLRESSNVSVTNSEFHHVWHGISFLNVDGVVIDNNSFHDIRTDGVRGGGASNIAVTNNHFTDFYPAPGDHPDAIQFWSTGQPEPGRNILISGNVIERGDGGIMQGIFLRDTFDNMPFENVRIVNNSVTGAMWNGIALAGVVGGEITDNVVIGTDGQRSFINLRNDTGVSVTGNTSSHYIFTSPHLDYAETNTTIAEPWLPSAPTPKPVPTPAPEPSPPEEAILPTGVEVLRLTKEQVVGIGNDGDNRIVGNTHGNELRGGAGNDLIQGLNGDDTLYGDGGNDDLRGDEGDDYLIGGAGNDILRGGAGDDELVGGDGNDTISGDEGSNTMTGGAGADVFLYRDGAYTGEVDRITDFTRGVDKMHLHGIDADVHKAGNQNFSFIGTSGFSNKAGELRYSVSGSDLKVEADVNGDAIADVTIILDNLKFVTADDFML